MIPHIKFFVKKNPAFGKPIEPVIPPTFEEWEYLHKLEPTKISSDYTWFVDNYVAKETQQRIHSAYAAASVDRILVDDTNIDTIILETEQRDDFIRWVNS